MKEVTPIPRCLICGNIMERKGEYYICKEHGGIFTDNHFCECCHSQLYFFPDHLYPVPLCQNPNCRSYSVRVRSFPNLEQVKFGMHTFPGRYNEGFLEITSQNSHKLFLSFFPGVLLYAST
ncbi:MAG: hypothetical protein NC114_10885, partial [Ruminococcus flavefaciens]|nr:hypothetical protein [Ruminococcus flavefaciens]